jgi:phosphatidylserine/phosphatidylglycerophosphate/cardiolipin synthase-like enzyme
MNQLHVSFGEAARDALCAAFDAAHASIDAELFSVSDPHVVASLNDAAARNVSVTLHVEGDPFRYDHKPDGAARSGSERDEAVRAQLRRLFSPDVHLVIEDHPDELWHAKAAVVDGAMALVSTANPTVSACFHPGDVLVADSSPRDVSAVAASIAGLTAPPGEFVVTGPGALMRDRIDHLLASDSDLRIAAEDLSDRRTVSELTARSAAGHHDRILIGAGSERAGRSIAQKQSLSELRHAGVDVRELRHEYMHEKYIDAGAEIYVGSANLTRNGLDEAHEVGLVAPAAEFGQGAEALRADFDRNWRRSVAAV